MISPRSIERQAFGRTDSTRILYRAISLTELEEMVSRARSDGFVGSDLMCYNENKNVVRLKAERDDYPKKD